MPNLDLAARRAARAAALSEPFTLDIGDQTFTVVSELPVAMSDAETMNDMTALVRLLLADPEADYDRFMATKPTMNDLLDIVEWYGVSLGESVRSAVSSRNTGGPSARTSNGSIPRG